MVFLSDVGLFLLTIGGAVFAYYRVLSLSLSPARLRRRSMALMRERMRSVQLESVRERIGNNILFSRLSPLGVSYWPFGKDGDQRYLVLESRKEGVVLDIQLDKLEQFVQSLPRPVAASAGLTSHAASTSSLAAAPPIWMLVRFQGRVTAGHRGLLRLDRQAFVQDPFMRRSSLEESLNRIFDIGEADEV